MVISVCVKRIGFVIAAAALAGGGFLFLKTYFLVLRYAKKTSAAAVDYARDENWLSLDGRGGAQGVDVFFLYPTCYFLDEEDFCAVDNAAMRGEAEKLRDAHIGIFDHANFFAPLYRQLSIPFIKKTMLLGLLSNAVAAIPLAD
ncbi:MAG: DUF3089 domain-containing protein, partial [Spirochaetaceae bacterium]|nr:DUF3089 domain-containing protein [Spirochaetaceae bacterium]